MSKKTVAIIGLDPFKIDFTDPAYVPHATLGARGIQGGLDHDLQELIALGYDAHLILISGEPDVATMEVTQALKASRWDCILIGAGVRTIQKNFYLFECLVNLVHALAPGSKICFNTRPDDSTEAVKRWMPMSDADPA